MVKAGLLLQSDLVVSHLLVHSQPWKYPRRTLGQSLPVNLTLESQKTLIYQLGSMADYVHSPSGRGLYPVAD